MVRNPRRRVAVVAALVGAVGAPTTAGARPRATKAEVQESGAVDPRGRELPRRHRFRLGLELEYMRLSAAVDNDTMEVTRYHYLPLALDFAYQVQFLKYLMARPSFAIGGNVWNTGEAMPLVLHPQIHTGYQGALLGVAFGYGWFTPPIRNKDVHSEIRDDPGQPIILNNHHVGGEISFTTKIHPRYGLGGGALSLQVRVAGVTSRTLHFELDKRRWRALLMFNIGWYFGDGIRKRREAREQQEALR